jgi:hypothetical protein
VEQPDPYRAVVHELLSDPAVSEGQMMGLPALEVGGKIFGGEFEGDLVLKLGRDRVAELIDAGRASQFDPPGQGREMEDWAQVPAPYEDWLELAEDAKEFARE